MDKALKERASRIIQILKRQYPQSKIALEHSNPLEILVATILSAQCTDKRVNMVIQKLFKKYRAVKDYAEADLGVFEREIRSTGFYKNKAKNIINAAKKIISDFGGEVPGEMEKLITLPGVARKTANIVLYSGFGKIEGIAVDTHVKRLSQRLGLSKFEDPVKIEQDLMQLVPKKDWGVISFLLIDHGRRICGAKKPLCGQCALAKLCPSAKMERWGLSPTQIVNFH
jgi:endonuclease-3